MDEILLRFGHLAQDIFGSLSNQDLVQCQEISRMWKHFMDVEKISQIRRIQNFVKPVISLKKTLKRSSVEEIKEMTSTIQKFQETFDMFPQIEAVVMEDYSIVFKTKIF